MARAQCKRGTGERGETRGMSKAFINHAAEFELYPGSSDFKH